MIRVVALGIALSCVFIVGAKNKREPVGAATFDDEYFGEFDGPLTEPAPPLRADANAIVNESHDDIMITREGGRSTLALATPSAR